MPRHFVASKLLPLGLKTLAAIMLIATGVTKAVLISRDAGGSERAPP